MRARSHPLGVIRAKFIAISLEFLRGSTGEKVLIRRKGKEEASSENQTFSLHKLLGRSGINRVARAE
jgi:hypothetical protein